MRPALRSLLRPWVHFVLPHLCLGCDRALGEGPGTGLALCPPCRARLEPCQPGACGGCGQPRPVGAPPAGPFQCAACQREPPPFDLLLAGWSYRPPLEKVLRALKFERLEFLAEPLALELATRFAATVAECEMVVAVPLHPLRRLQRGYNQAELLARPLAKALGLPLSAALARRRLTPPQVGLDRAARRRNLERAFVPRRGEDVAGRALLLVDDVTTTGSTLAAATRALKAAGARRVVALVAARTPRESSVEEPR